MVVGLAKNREGEEGRDLTHKQQFSNRTSSPHPSWQKKMGKGCQSFFGGLCDRTGSLSFLRAGQERAERTHPIILQCVSKFWMLVAELFYLVAALGKVYCGAFAVFFVATTVFSF